MTNLPKFSLAFLKPKYWLFWLLIGLARLILCLPYPFLVKMAKFLASNISKLNMAQRRINIAKRNIELCFPDLNPEQQQQLLEDNLFSTVMGFIETGMAWFWSDKRIKKWSTVEGIDYLKDNAQHGIILIGIHFLHLELGARIIGLHHPGIGVYRPNDNLVLDWLQTKGRLRSNKSMLDRKDIRGMIKAIKKQGEMIWYAPDHDYGRQNAVFVPFFAVEETACTTGSYILIKSSPASKVIPFATIRQPNAAGYHLIVSPPVDFSHADSPEKTAILMNKIVEREISRAPEQYMWLHRRFKTRPNPDDKSLYL